jgi:hypothetical protein
MLLIFKKTSVNEYIVTRGKRDTSGVIAAARQKYCLANSYSHLWEIITVKINFATSF